jgi:hypothetical protein
MDTRTLLTLALLGLPHLLRLPGPVAPTREPERRDRTIERAWRTGGCGIMAFRGSARADGMTSLCRAGLL